MAGKLNARFTNGAVMRRIAGIPGHKNGVLGKKVTVKGGAHGGTSDHKSYPMQHGVTATPTTPNPFQVTGNRMMIDKNPPPSFPSSKNRMP